MAGPGGQVTTKNRAEDDDDHPEIGELRSKLGRKLGEGQGGVTLYPLTEGSKSALDDLAHALSLFEDQTCGERAVRAATAALTAAFFGRGLDS